MFKSNMDGMNCGTSCEPMSEQVKQSFHDKFGMILDGKVLYCHPCSPFVIFLIYFPLI
jgi:hypothetical protein